MAKRNGSSIRRRILGRRIRKLREQAGYTLEAAGPALEVSASKLSRIETGQQPVDIHLVKSILDLFDAGGDNWNELMTLAREARQRGWYRAYGLGDSSYVGYETEATQVQEYAVGFVPGLLQVPGHSRALYDAIPIRRNAEEREREVEVRTIRQRRLRSDDDPLRLVAILDEAVLRNPVGGSQTHRAQLTHLLEEAELPTVTPPGPARWAGRAPRARLRVHPPQLRRARRAGHGLRRARTRRHAPGEGAGRHAG